MKVRGVIGMREWWRKERRDIDGQSRGKLRKRENGEG